MKRKLVEELKPIKTRKSGWWTTVQQLEDTLVLNVFKDKALEARHCINLITYEYETYRAGRWRKRKLDDAIGLKAHSYYYRSGRDRDVKERFKMSAEDERIAKNALQSEELYITNLYEIINRRETEYGREKREMAEQRRVERVNALMAEMPQIPEDIKEWIDRKENGGEDYALKDRETGKWSCSHCGEYFKKEELKRADGEKEVRNNDKVICPRCQKEIRYLTRKRKVDIITHFALVQPIDDEKSVVRHFDAEIYCGGGKKEILFDEAVRIILLKGLEKYCTPPFCDIYYSQYPRGWKCTSSRLSDADCFDNIRNHYNRKEYAGYLYDGGIGEAFKRTGYELWTRLFIQMAAVDIKVDYNRLMATRNDTNLIALTEMLFRGRFYRLLRETSEDISLWKRKYYGPLELEAEYIEDVFGIGDRQKINRIRDKNGGEMMLGWMQWSERHKEKISDKALEWLQANKLTKEDMSWLLCRMSAEKAMNYIERQKKESYKGKTTKQVIGQYEDYMAMCDKLHKDTHDEMIYRPRELKRRHDEAVAEIKRRQAELKAEEYSQKFGEAESVLKEIKEKFEYMGETFFIKVPDRIVDIVAEGNYLHHCAGATDRYFDRIKQHETYICFLRKTAEPDTPYYTIEVEPGGTIRQHRGMYDEESELDMVKPFLREWQKEIRKRMSRKDHERAAVSKVKHEENIKELKQKNNTRVLNGLMEDFMEAAG